MAVSQVRQNFHQECEAMLNKQINMELYASYVYLSMASYFSRDDVALHGFAKDYFERSSDEREHAQKFIKYQNMRGGRVVFQDIAKPNVDEWNSALEVVEATLALEKSVNQSLLDLHACATSKNDAQFTDFIESDFLGEQVEDIKKVGDLLTKLRRAGDGVGLHIIDKEMH